MKSSVTTRTGDTGETSALSGRRLPKNHIIMETGGALDELRAHTALLRCRIVEERPAQSDVLATDLLWILHVYFLIGARCSDVENHMAELRHRDVIPADVERLEAMQTGLEKALTLPNGFTACAANALAAQAHVATVLARKLERRLVTLRDEVPTFDDAPLFAFVNRLSDYFYILARTLENGDHTPVDYSLLDND